MGDGILSKIAQDYHGNRDFAKGLSCPAVLDRARRLSYGWPSKRLKVGLGRMAKSVLSGSS